MRTLLYIAAFLFSGFYITSGAQTLTESSDEARDVATRLAETSRNTLDQAITNETQLRNNEVMISQIGDGNISNFNVVSSNATATIAQRGNNNFTGITASANQTNKTILQTGNDNTVLNFGIFKTENQLLNFTQNGNGNTFVKYGENSISDKLKISVQGNDKTVIVRNYN